MIMTPSLTSCELLLLFLFVCFDTLIDFVFVCPGYVESNHLAETRAFFVLPKVCVSSVFHLLCCFLFDSAKVVEVS